MTGVLYETPRLLVRWWRESDRPAFRALNADPIVMRFFQKPLDTTESDAFFDRLEARRREDGFAFPAVERKADGAFIGFVGLATARLEAPFVPAVEIGWRVVRAHWRQGYAAEAAFGALDYGFGRLGLAEIVSFTAAPNQPSRAVMERIGMVRDPGGDFAHPALPCDSPLQRHVLYRISRSAWAQA